MEDYTFDLNPNRPQHHNQKQMCISEPTAACEAAGSQFCQVGVFSGITLSKDH